MKKTLVAICATLVSLIAFAEPSITDVTARQRYPWNGLVDIVVTLEGWTADEMKVIGCSFAAIDSATGAAIPVTNITQIGADAGAGTTWKRCFVWDAAKDVGAVKINDVALTVDTKGLGVQLWENGPYWAECNVGASKPEEYGYYFWWGDTIGYKRNAANNGWISVKDGTARSFDSCLTYSKDYSQLQSAGYIGLSGTLVAAYDAATVHLGAPWRMPTSSEFSAIIRNCDIIWTEHDGVLGRLVRGRGAYASESIFLPAAGYGLNSYFSSTNSVGYYWSSEPVSIISQFSQCLFFSSGQFDLGVWYRDFGQPVRSLRGFTQNDARMPIVTTTTHLALDCQTGVRTAAEAEVLTYSTNWVEGTGADAVAVVTVNGEVISEQLGSGTVEWTPEYGGTYTLTHTVMAGGAQVGETLTATFRVDLPLPEGGPYTETVDGITWTFKVTDGAASVGGGDWNSPAVPTSTTGVIAIPLTLGGCPVMSVGDWAFQRCSGLTSVTISEGVTSIGDYAFAYCGGLTSVTVPEGVTNIGDWAFSDCSGLTSVTIPSSVTNIETCAFLGCSGLTNVAIPSSVTSIGGGAFAHCSGLKAIDVAMGNFAYASKDGVLFNKQMNEIVMCPGGKTGSYTMPSSVTLVGNDAFERCSGLTSVTIPGSVTSIGDGAFLDCSGLTSVTIGEGVTNVGDWAFQRCSGLTSVTIPSSMTSIGVGAFLGCGGLKSVTICEGVTSIGGGAFSGCSGLTGVTIPSSVTSIGDEAFSGCSGLASVTIGEGVMSIGVRAFSGCSGLTSVVIPSSMTSVGVGAFWPCENLNIVDFEGAPPEGVANSGVRQDAAIRYNEAYQAEWQPVIEACGWTNAKPYKPFSPEPPVISPVDGTIFATSLTVTMACVSEGATIWYTTDGSEPTMASAKYTKKFRIYGKTTIKAIAFYEDGTPSEMAVAEYAKGKCDDPVIVPSDGTAFEHSGQRVSIAWAGEDGVLRYTTDGSDPTEESPVYTQSFTVDSDVVVKAKAFGDQYFDSGITTARLTRVWVKLATPEIAAESAFTGTKNKVVISCTDEGATIYYTLDGSEPTADSPVYEKPFCVGESCTVRAKAVQYDYLDSDVAEKSMTRNWSIGETMGKPDHTFETSGEKGFVRVVDETAALGESMQSGEIKNSQTSILSTVVVGPGTLKFKWKTSCEYDEELHEWDRAEFAVDGDIKGILDGETEWIAVEQRIEGNDAHTVTWKYIKDDTEFKGEDCLWVSEYVWASDLTETQTTGVPVPYGWLEAKCTDVVDEYDSYEKVAKQTALNKRLAVEQCYVAGVDPESATNDFRTVFALVDGVPVITWEPDLGAARAYKVWGSENLHDWQWPTNALHRFFKVTVEME